MPLTKAQSATRHPDGQQIGVVTSHMTVHHPVCRALSLLSLDVAPSRRQRATSLLKPTQPTPQPETQTTRQARAATIAAAAPETSFAPDSPVFRHVKCMVHPCPNKLEPLPQLPTVAQTSAILAAADGTSPAPLQSHSALPLPLPVSAGSQQGQTSSSSHLLDVLHQESRSQLIGTHVASFKDNSSSVHIVGMGASSPAASAATFPVSHPIHDDFLAAEAMFEALEHQGLHVLEVSNRLWSWQQGWAALLPLLPPDLRQAVTGMQCEMRYERASGEDVDAFVACYARWVCCNKIDCCDVLHMQAQYRPWC